MAATKQEFGAPMHVVVFPWLAFGHIIPFLELSEHLAKRGHFVTFVSGPRNLAKLRPVLPELKQRIRLLPLALPRVEGLPDGAESTADVPPEKVEVLKVAFDGLAAPFAAFLAEACSGGEARDGHAKKPDWIIPDFAHHWLPPIADEHKVPCALFVIFPAAFMAFLGSKAHNEAHPRTAAEHFTVPPPWIPPPSPIAFRKHEAEWLVQAACQPNASGPSDIERFFMALERSPVFVCRCSREVDGSLCDLLGDLYGRPVLPSGPLAPFDAAARAAAANARGDDDDEETAGLMRWLDAQPERSVIYVAFGSEAPLTPEQASAIALGLELAAVRFVWALRKPVGEGKPPLPEGFERRARESGRGVVRVGWVPQMRVLAHAAVGAFFTHAGLSSLMESFLFGHPIVMLPLFADQGLTARLMTERRVGLEVPRGDDSSGSFAGEDVAATVRRVMVEEEGKVFARNSEELKEVLWDTARQERYIDELVEHLLQRRRRD